MMYIRGLHSLPSRRRIDMRAALTALIIASVVLLAGCGKKSADNRNSADQTEKSPNQELYEKVMDIHNEVMPKMDDLYKAKIKLSSRLKETTELGENEKKVITAKIARLDSASESMMAWMRQFNPLPDSLGEEKAKAYLDKQLKEVTKVKENILEALADAQAGN